MGKKIAVFPEPGLKGTVESDALHFGGREYSGIGSLFGRAGLNSFRQIKMVTIDANPTLQDWWYPYPDDRFHSGSR